MASNYDHPRRRGPLALGFLLAVLVLVVGGWLVMMPTPAHADIATCSLGFTGSPTYADGSEPQPGSVVVTIDLSSCVAEREAGMNNPPALRLPDGYWIGNLCQGGIFGYPITCRHSWEYEQLPGTTERYDFSLSGGIPNDWETVDSDGLQSWSVTTAAPGSTALTVAPFFGSPASVVVDPTGGAAEQLGADLVAWTSDHGVPLLVFLLFVGIVVGLFVRYARRGSKAVTGYWDGGTYVGPTRAPR